MFNLQNGFFKVQRFDSRRGLHGECNGAITLPQVLNLWEGFSAKPTEIKEEENLCASASLRYAHFAAENAAHISGWSEAGLST